MSLPNVATGQPHVAAHNNERAMLNAIEDLSLLEFSSNLNGRIAEQIVTPLSEKSDVEHTHTGMVTSATATTLWTGTQAEYDALGTYDTVATLYFIKDA